MERLFILGFLCILIVNAQDVGDEITVEYATVTRTSPGQGNPDSLILSLCNVNVPNDPQLTLVPELTIQLEGEGSDPDSVENINGVKKDPCFDFNFSDHEQFMEKQNDIYLKVKDTTLYEGKKEKETIHEFQGKFTFKELKADIDVQFYNEVNIIQFKNGEVAAFQVDEGSITIPECNTNKDLCVSPNVGKLSQKVKIYNGKTDTIPNSNPKSLADSILPCDGDLKIIVVYDNTAEVNPKGFTFSATGIENFYAVSDSVNFKLNALIEMPNPQESQEFIVIQHTDNTCEKIPAPVRDMDFLKPFDNTVEVSWDHDDAPGQNKYYLEVNGVTDDTLIKNLHIDCSQDDLTTCIAYVFDDKITDEAQIQFELSESVENEPPTPGKMKTKETYKVPKPKGKKSLKALNLNQFEINWNTKQGKLCLEDSLFKKAQKSQYKYELVIGFDEGNWKKLIANYNDESTICFNDFEVTELIENKLGVHFLVMKRESDTNQIVASDMITTDLIVPEISEVNDETISLEFENLNSPFLIRDEKTKQIISKNEKKIHNLAFLKSSHEKKSIFNRNLVLETRKEHTQMKVHFKIPQKVNAA